jgi:hypothetical protein
VVLIAKRAHPTRLHDEVALTQRLPDPPDRKRPENMPVSNDQHVPLDRLVLGLPNHRPMVLSADLAYQPVDALDNILRRLAPGTAVFPDIPRPEAPLCPSFPDLRGRDALVLAVVPLPDVGRDGDLGVGARGGGLRMLDLPRVGVLAAEVEELEGPLGAFPRRDISGPTLKCQLLPVFSPRRHYGRCGEEDALTCAQAASARSTGRHRPAHDQSLEHASRHSE